MTKKTKSLTTFAELLPSELQHTSGGYVWSDWFNSFIFNNTSKSTDGIVKHKIG